MPGFKVELAATDFYSEDPSLRNSYYGSDKKTFIYHYQWIVPILLGNSTGTNDPIIFLKDCSLPSITINKETYTGASLQYKFASEVIFDDIRMSFYDNVGLLPYIINWRKSVWTSDGGLAMASDYKKDTQIQVLDPSGIPTQNFFLIGSWPSSIKYGDLTYTSSEIKFIELNLTYDWAEEQSLQ